MARSKLQSVVGGGVKDSCSLHRWVLLKNSIIRSHPSDATPAASDKADVSYVRHDEDEGRDEEEDAFMFPDPSGGNSENQWLDSLLETFGDDDDDVDVESPTASVSLLPVDEDDEPLSPLYSPMSSSDDLVGNGNFFYQSPPIANPYPVPYPPIHPPLVPAWFELESSADSLLHEPLPHFHADDEDLQVPEAIEDTSDDESDAPSTPYSNSMSSLPSPDPASVPLPPERTRLRAEPHVYIDADDSYFYPFELDPQPSHDDNHHSEIARVFHSPFYQEC
ncbi:hypothetical protein A0H81_04529 [Grifola frondosa]|uniref:Uncharacterized protein n=1 Tax=Grifola frondosa TaxID=5627 RepID=A0A1C7MDW1_GRIFR|nr:hypothetical protein A0H81_04529 [Grifola frondosa]